MNTALCANLKPRKDFESGAPRRFQNLFRIPQSLNRLYEDQLVDYEALGILYYAIYNPLSGRKGRFKNRAKLEVYRLISMM